MVLVLIALSVVGLTIVLYKFIQYRGYSARRLKRADRALDQWSAGDAEGALRQLAADKSPIAQLLGKGVAWLRDPGRNEETIREELIRQGQQIVTRVNGLNVFVELIAYLSPMLGLLGTVLGMIDVFYGLASDGGGADTGVLAGGICRGADGRDSLRGDARDAGKPGDKYSARHGGSVDPPVYRRAGCE